VENGLGEIIIQATCDRAHIQKTMDALDILADTLFFQRWNKVKLLKNGYKNASLQYTIKRFAPPGDNNSPAKYLKFVLSKMAVKNPVGLRSLRLLCFPKIIKLMVWWLSLAQEVLISGPDMMLRSLTI
jgi:hypothetical protein